MKKILSMITVCTLSLVLFAGCSGNQTKKTQDQQTPAQDTQKSATLSGAINLGGSTSVESIIVAAVDEFTAQNPDVTGKYDATGSSVGIKNAIDGTYHLGFSSRELKTEETAAGLSQKTFALDGIAVALNPANKVKDLTLAQLKDIFTGKIKNWKEVGGDDAKIVVVSREAGSGTRGAFEELVKYKDEELSKDATIKDGNGNVATYIAGEKNAIGYLSFVTLDENKGKVIGIKVEGVDPTVENVLNKSYKLSRPFIVTYKDANLNDAEKAFVDFLMSDDGQALVEQNGAISIKK
ncbi:MAG: phosphate ABC transporter substrate-binding protein [Clostridiales bacterium]|nr:phosphate ABC transporter substrate-binding protein [Clostridiales bacterium]